MSEVLERSAASPAAVPAARLQLLGPVEVCRQGRRNAPWAYAKLPALLALLGHAGRRELRRDWLAALLWPERDTASLRRALYDLRRQLRPGRTAPELITSSRAALGLPTWLATDLEDVEAAWRNLQGPAPDIARAQQALALWRGEFAAGLTVTGADEFEYWLRQARAHWEQRALGLALALAETQLRRGRAADAAITARLAADRVPDSEPARALLWRCLVAAGARLEAVDDVRRYQEVMTSQGLASSAALRGQAGGLGLMVAPAAPAGAAATDDAALAAALQEVLRRGPGGAAIESLLDDAQRRLDAQASRLHTGDTTLLLRRALVLRLMHAPWHEPMSRLAASAEALLCHPLSDEDRIDLVQPLATWHGWMGRGIRGEVLLRGCTELLAGRGVAPAMRVRCEMTLALCHSCSTGDAERSIRAARRGIRIARDGAVPGCQPAFQMLVANAALSRDAPGDARVSRISLERAAGEGPLQRFDLVNHRQLSALWQLTHGDPAHALALAEEGVRMAQAVPFPLQGLSNTLLALSARLMLGERDGLEPGLAEATALARRMASQGYLMIALFAGGALAMRQGDKAGAAARVAEAQRIARACGARRIHKLPRALIGEAQAQA